MLETLDYQIPGTRAFRHTGTFDGARLTMSYLVDVAERESRRARGLGAVTDEFLLAGLLSLPSDDLGPIEKRFTRILREPVVATVIQDPEGGFWGQSRLGVPLKVLEIETEPMSWRRGCSIAHNWVGYAPRLVHIVDEVAPFELTEASHYGIGLIRESGERILEPGPYRPRRWTSSRWRLAELVYEQFLEMAG